MTPTYTVMGRVRAVKQPRGGYINPKLLQRTQFDDGKDLSEESVHPATIGMVVDYLTRFDQGDSAEKAFQISAKGAMTSGRVAEFKQYLSKIKGLDDESIRNACYAVWFDQVYRAGTCIGQPTDNEADSATCGNIRIMVERSRNFFKEYGPVVIDAPVFPGGYSDVVVNGDGDFVTKDTLWEFKVSKNEPTKENTLQLAMYFIMSQRSIVPEYGSLKKIGIFNPRLNAAFTLEMKDVPADIIKTIEKDVICYSD